MDKNLSFFSDRTPPEYIQRPFSDNERFLKSFKKINTCITVIYDHHEETNERAEQAADFQLFTKEALEIALYIRNSIRGYLF